MAKVYKLDLENKAALIVVSLVIIIVSGILTNYLNNPIWIYICNGLVIFFGLFTLFLFITFLVQFVMLKAAPELTSKINELEFELQQHKKFMKENE